MWYNLVSEPELDGRPLGIILNVLLITRGLSVMAHYGTDRCEMNISRQKQDGSLEGTKIGLPVILVEISAI